MITRRTAVALAAAGTLAIAVPALADADKQARATGLVDRLLTDAHAALSAGGDPEALRSAVSRAFAFDIWERFLIGEREDQFTADQRETFRALLPGFLSHLYAEQFDRGMTTPPSLGEARDVRRDVLVASAFPRPKGGDLPVEWRVREFPDRGPQVIDVMVAGTSFLLLKKEEFAAILAKGGAPALLQHMRENTY